LMAAEVLIAAHGDYRRGQLESYAERIRERFGIPRSVAISDWVPAAFLRYTAAKLLANRWFTRHVVLDRWFLHAQVPALDPIPAEAACGLP
jgi:menaquinone-9 beta-reductase